MFLISPNWIILPLKKGTLTIIALSKWGVKGVTVGNNWALFFCIIFSPEVSPENQPSYLKSLKHMDVFRCTEKPLLEAKPLTKVWCHRCRRMTLSDRGFHSQRYFDGKSTASYLALKIQKIHLVPWLRWWLGACSLCSGSLVLHRTSWEGLETSSFAQPLPESHSKLLNHLYKQKNPNQTSQPTKKKNNPQL